MSEAQKPVETPVAAVEEATPAVVEPVPEVTAEETATEAAPAAVEEPVVEAAAVEPVVEAPKKEFAGEGILGYKGPGGFLKKLAGFQKKFFWFGVDAVEPEHLKSYLRGEKAEVANHNAAWSSQTGKGLLYFSKHAAEKATPAGIINLAEISDISEDGPEFSFVAGGQKNVFQASSVAERESWVAALKEKSAEAKESSEAITGSDGYKESHSALSKPVIIAAAVVAPVVAAAKVVEAKKEEEKAVAKEDKLEPAKARKSRSASRKRNSIFGNFGLGSKKEEDKKEAPVAAVEEATPAVVEPVVAEAAPVEAAEVVEPAVEEPVAETAVAPVAAEPTKPANKRNSSLFGNFSSRFGSKKPASEEAPATPAKDATAEVPVSTDAPVIPEPEASEPLAAAIAAPEVVAAEPTEVATETPATEAVKETKPITKAEKRKSALPFGFGSKKEKPTSDSEGEKPKSPFAKLRQTVKGKSSPKAAAAEKVEKTEEVAAAVEPATETVAETPVIAEEAAAVTEEEAVVAAPVPVTHATPVVAATA